MRFSHSLDEQPQSNCCVRGKCRKPGTKTGNTNRNAVTLRTHASITKELPVVVTKKVCNTSSPRPTGGMPVAKIADSRSGRVSSRSRHWPDRTGPGVMRSWDEKIPEEKWSFSDRRLKRWPGLSSGCWKQGWMGRPSAIDRIIRICSGVGRIGILRPSEVRGSSRGGTPRLIFPLLRLILDVIEDDER